ncbi:hypothetical protein E3P99_03492 [Wallemia hederae]|uniref:Uncharacterized protein n=1 Tax=Wallemia hederae TaxID=1540922 RepID=A0A4T0FJS6_9BASI|nr:hypothetical protein E3P99_03492 [Wallemia hederae]
MTTLLNLPNELLLQIIQQSPELSLANKRLYFIGYRFMAASVVGVGGMDRNGFDSRRHSKSEYRRFSRYLNNLSPSVAGCVKKLSISLGKCRNKSEQLTRTSYHTKIARNISKLENLEEIILSDPSCSDLDKMALSSTCKDVTIFLKKPLGRWSGVLSTLLRIAPGVKTIRVHYIAASMYDLDIAALNCTDTANGAPHLLTNLDYIVFRAIPAQKKLSAPGEYEGLSYSSDFEDMLESCVIYGKKTADNTAYLGRGMCINHTLQVLSESYQCEECICCVQGMLESAVVI